MILQRQKLGCDEVPLAPELIPPPGTLVARPRLSTASGDFGQKLDAP